MAKTGLEQKVDERLSISDAAQDWGSESFRNPPHACWLVVSGSDPNCHCFPILLLMAAYTIAFLSFGG